MAGSVTKRVTKDGRERWQARLDLDGHTANGKRNQRLETFPSKRVALCALKSWEAERKGGYLPVKVPKTLEEYLVYWLGSVKRHVLRPTTWESYVYQLDRYVKPRLGAIKLPELRAIDVQTLYADLMDHGGKPAKEGQPGRPLSAAMVRYCHRLLKASMAHALRDHLVPTNIMDDVTPPRAAEVEMCTWSTKQVSLFLAAARAYVPGRTENQGLGPIWLVALLTGMRLGELLGLRWADVDLDEGTLVVRQEAVPLRGHMIIQAPKSKAGRRSLALPPLVVDALKSHRPIVLASQMAAKVWADGDLVFPSSVGTPISHHNARMHYHRQCVAAGLTPVRIHDLRHTHATLLHAGGTDLRTVSDQLGHSRIATTSDIYVRAASERQRDAVNALATSLQPKVKKG